MRVKTHVRNTAQPETLEALHPGPIEKSEQFEKLTDFDVDRRKQPEADMAPCPICHQTNKYLHGALAYFPRLKVVAAIGHCCADQEVLAAADREYRERTTRDQQEDYLLVQLPLVPARLAVVERIRPAATEALRVYRQFRTQAPEIQRLLRQANRAGGRLVVSEQIVSEAAALGPSGFRGGGQYSTRDIEFGVLRGSIAVAGDYNPVKEVDRIGGLLRPHDRLDSEEARIDYIASLDLAGRRSATVNLREAERSYAKCQSRMAEFCSFFTPENFGPIRAWASHQAHPHPFAVTITVTKGGAVACQFRVRSELVCHLAINPVVRDFGFPWPQRS